MDLVLGTRYNASGSTCYNGLYLSWVVLIIQVITQQMGMAVSRATFIALMRAKF